VAVTDDEAMSWIDGAVWCTPQKVHLATIRPRLIRLEPPPWEADEDSGVKEPQPGRLRHMFSRLSLSSNTSASSPKSMHTSASTSPVTPRSWLTKRISTPNLLRKKFSFEGRTAVKPLPPPPTLPPAPKREDSFAKDIFRVLRRR